MTTPSDIAGPLKTKALRSRSCIGGRLVGGSRGVFRCIPTGSWSRELEAGCRFLLLGKLGSLLRLWKSKGVTALVAATRRTTTTTALAPVFVLVIAQLLLLLVKIGIPRGTGRRRGRRAHADAGEGRLVAAMGRLIGSVHRDTKLLLLGQLGKLKGVDLRRNAADGATALHRGIEARNLAHLLAHLLWLQQAHINILLVSRCNLMLLLLKELDLLLYGQLLHFVTSVHGFG